MKVLLGLALALGLLSMGGVSIASSPINVVASNWEFTPGTITLHVGQTTTLHLTSSEGVHGIQSDDLGIKQTMIMPGKGTDVTFTPTKAGTYVLHCTVFCGMHHATMALTIKVEA